MNTRTFREATENGFNESEPVFWEKLLLGISNSGESAERKTVFIIGDSNAELPFGRSLENTYTPMMSLLAQAGIDNIDIYGYGFGGTRADAIIGQIDDVLAAHPDAYIFVITGGNDVSTYRPYHSFEGTDSQIEWEATLDAMFQRALLHRGKIFFNSITFRTYRVGSVEGEVVDDTAFDAIESSYAASFNDNIFIPKLAQYFPEQINVDGRPIGDAYNNVRNRRKEILDPIDGIHPVRPTGFLLRRLELIDLINYYVNGAQKPFPVTRIERELTPHEEGLVIVNLGATGGSATNKFSNEITSSNILIDEDGYNSGLSFELTNLKTSSTVTFRGDNSATGAIGFDGTLNNSAIYGNSMSLDDGGFSAILSTPNPNTFYRVGAVGHSPSTSETRGFGISVLGTEVLSVVTSVAIANEPVYADVETDSDGNIIMDIAVNLGSFSDICGLSFQKI